MGLRKLRPITIKPSGGLSINWADPLASGLVGYWPLNLGSGQKAENIAMSRISGTFSGATPPAWTLSPPYGPGLTFDGSTSYLSGIAASGQLDFLVSTAIFSMAFRFRFASVSADAIYTLFGGDLSSTNKSVSIYYDNRVSQGSPKSIKMLIGRGAGGLPTINFQSATNAIVDTNWHHVIVTANVSSGAGYLDGIPLTAATNSSSGAPSGPLTALPNIGATVTGTSPLNGQIEHFAIWNRVLCAEDVAALAFRPERLIRPRTTSYFFGFLPLSTATGAITLGTLTPSGTATFTASASGAIVLSSLAPSGVGSFTALASGAITLGSLVVVGISGLVSSGSGSISLAALSASGVGEFAATASGSVTLAALSVLGISGTVSVGSGAITLGSIAVAGLGTSVGGVVVTAVPYPPYSRSSRPGTLVPDPSKARWSKPV